jgi:hypothetical protein
VLLTALFAQESLLAREISWHTRRPGGPGGPLRVSQQIRACRGTSGGDQSSAPRVVSKVWLLGSPVGLLALG